MASSNTTKKLIAGCMKELMQTKPFTKITVGDIVAASKINRNSFYYHFQDKYDLLNWIFYTELTEKLNKASEHEIANWKMVEIICEYFYENKKIYQNALGFTGQNSFVDYYKELLKTFISLRLEDLGRSSEETSFSIDFFTDAFVAATLKWLSEGAKTQPCKFVGLMRNSLAQAAKILLEIEESG